MLASFSPVIQSLTDMKDVNAELHVPDFFIFLYRFIRAIYTEIWEIVKTLTSTLTFTEKGDGTHTYIYDRWTVCKRVA